MSYTGHVANCSKDGHCLHEGTAIGSLYCCRCGQYIKSIAQEQNFYEEKLQGIRQRSIERYGEAWQKLANM